MVRIATIIAAAGAGERMGGTIPKAYRSFGDGVVLRRAAQPFADYGRLQIVIRAEDSALYQEAMAGFTGDVAPPVTGGATRAASVLAGLKAVADYRPDIVLIHDAARPFVPAGLVETLLAAMAEGYLGAAPALAITDSLKKMDGAAISPVAREGLVRIQTPQSFDYQVLMAAFAHATLDETDELAVLAQQTTKVKLVGGDHRNIKLTFSEDFRLWPMRTGMGVDAHRFAQGNHIMLGGIKIAHDKTIAAHSDGDVVLHALCDAIFGAIADGDIGTHFPNDPKWLDAASDVFLKAALAKAKEKNCRIVHADITIICAAPAIAPHRQAMREKLAALLDVPVAQISIKATTTDGMGLIGNKEGIAATAIVQLEAIA